MQKYIYKGGLLDAGLTVGRAIVAHFNRHGVYQAATTRTHQGAIAVNSSEYITAAKTLTADENGKNIIYASLASGAVTLPLARHGKGIRFSLSIHVLPTSGVGAQCTPATGDKFIGMGLTGTANQVLRCAAASDVLGDSVEIVSDGIDTWHIIRRVGTWSLA